jgi:hypothetical protein
MFWATILATSISLSPAVADLTHNPADVAQREFIALSHGTIVRSDLSARMSAALTDSEVSATGAQLAPLGDFKRMGLNSTRHVEGDTEYAFIMVCTGGNVRMALLFAPDGQVDKITFEPWAVGGSPAYIGPPGYGDPSQTNMGQNSSTPPNNPAPPN